MKHLEHSKPLLPAYLISRPRPLVLATVLAALVTLGGCASLPPDLAAGGDLAVERADSASARLGLVSVRATDYALRVSGTVVRRHGTRGPIHGHLHIEALGDGDMPLDETTTGYQRHNAKARKARFSESLEVDPTVVRKVRVIHHG